jgi:hypothetical protein
MRRKKARAMEQDGLVTPTHSAKEEEDEDEGEVTLP